MTAQRIEASTMSFLDWSRALTSNQGELAAFFLMMISAGLFRRTRDVLGSMPDVKILVLLKLDSRFFRTAGRMVQLKSRSILKKFRLTTK
jgi:hypothetical protein